MPKCALLANSQQNSNGVCYQLGTVGLCWPHLMETPLTTCKSCVALRRNASEFQKWGPDPRSGVAQGSWKRYH